MRISMNNYYTGIGSRKTPPEVLQLMSGIAIALGSRGYILRSGAAGGADSAFESGAGTEKQIFLPWKGFNGNPSAHYHIPGQAFHMAEQLHPAWYRCSQGAQKLHARNTMQILGEDLNTPSAFVICWTPNGAEVGGTATAIKLAKLNGIPVFNLGDEDGYLNLMNYVNLIEGK